MRARSSTSFLAALGALSLALACTGCRESGTAGQAGDGKLVTATAQVDLAADAIRSPGTARLTLRTPEGKSFAVVRDRAERVGASGTAWHGRVEGEPGSMVTIVENKGIVAGNIYSSAGVFRLRTGTRGEMLMDRINMRAFPREDEPTPRSGRRDKEDDADDSCATDSGENIDVMVVYTDDARTAAGSTEAMEAEVYLAVAQANQSYADSGVNQRLRLVHTVEVDYAETNNTATDRDRLKGLAEGFLDGVHGLRDSFGADSVMLIVKDYTASCGKSFIMSPVGNAFQDSAFGVTDRGCASTNHSFYHEMGHQMSARHDWPEDDTNNSPFAFNHGFLKPTPTSGAAWRTIMSYDNCASGCIRIGRWSNPNLTFNGDATGISTGDEPTDNAQALNSTASTVANFRCSSPGRPEVWMKDRWNDTGAEPEPLTAGQPMWESPYIWVRHDQDVGLFHQHEHENPVNGVPNWAYVKLHNGGPAMSGTLELHGAPASTGLSWQSDWTLIGSIPVTIAANSSRVVEIPWPSPSELGHFCLVARWVSASDPMNAEGTDINANTIANNNIVWRNVNIVEMDEDGDASFTVRVSNPDKRSAALTTLRFILPRNSNGTSFARFGAMSVEIDPRLIRQSGDRVKAAALEQGKDGWTLVRGRESAELAGLVLPPGAQVQIRIRLRRPASNYPRDAYRLRVEQWREPSQAGAAGRRLVGGVSYDIRTGRGRTYFEPRAK